MERGNLAIARFPHLTDVAEEATCLSERVKKFINLLPTEIQAWALDSKERHKGKPYISCRYNYSCHNEFLSSRSPSYIINIPPETREYEYYNIICLVRMTSSIDGLKLQVSVDTQAAQIYESQQSYHSCAFDSYFQSPTNFWSPYFETCSFDGDLSNHALQAHKLCP